MERDNMNRPFNTTFKKQGNKIVEINTTKATPVQTEAQNQYAIDAMNKIENLKQQHIQGKIPATSNPPYTNPGAIIRDRSGNMVNTIPTYKTGGYYIIFPGSNDGYYLLFSNGKTYIQGEMENKESEMNVLFRNGAGHVSESEMQSIVKSKPSFANLKSIYQILKPVSNVGDSILPSTWAGNDVIQADAFRYDRNTSTIIW